MKTKEPLFDAEYLVMRLERRNMAGKYFWIKERDNPQLGTYYVAMGKITTAEARRYESPRLYGSNIMHKYATQEAYEAELSRLKISGETVQSA